MNIISIDNYRASQRIHPLSLLAQMSSRRANGCLRVSDGSTSWWIYLSNGDLVHASHSVSPFKRLERHLRQMNQDAPGLTPTVRGQIHQLFSTNIDQDIEWLNPPDYQAIQWLVDKGHLTIPQAATLLDKMAKEVFETFLQVREGVHELVDCPEFMSSSLLCLLELRPLVEACQRKLREGGGRQSITSTYPPVADKRSTNQRAIDSDLPSLPLQPSSEDLENSSSVLPTANSASEPSLRVETVMHSDAEFTVENVSIENGGGDSQTVENSLARDRENPLPFMEQAQTLEPSSSFRPSDSSFQSPEQRQSDSIFSNLSRKPSPTADSSTRQFGVPAAQPLNFRRPGTSPSDQRGSVPSGVPSSQPRNGLRSSSVARPTSSSSSVDGNSKLLREPASKRSPNPSFFRDKDKREINQRPSLKEPFRPSGGYPAPSGGRSLGASKPQGERMYKVACIDDSPMILHMIEAFLEDKSFAVIKINDPVRALMELMRAKPDIILLDITMPNLDGYELCALLRSRPDFRNTPIIMVTGSKGLIDRAKARLVKASGYLTKPFNQTQLLKMIFKLLK